MMLCQLCAHQVLHTKKPENEYSKEEYTSTFADFCDMAMQVINASSASRSG
jgi:hypothetical protein